MLYFKYPLDAIVCDLTHGERTVYIFLLYQHFRYTRGDYEKEFFLTNRDLSKLSFCSLDTVYKAKLKLKELKLIDFHTGSKNRTFYKILLWEKTQK